LEHVRQDFHEYVNGHASTSGEGALDHYGQEAEEDSGGESDSGQAKGPRQAAGKGPAASGSRRSRPGAEAKAGGKATAQRSKKTKGRVKIKMEFIENKIRRYTTFSKRKTGIMKKVSAGALGQLATWLSDEFACLLRPTNCRR